MKNISVLGSTGSIGIQTLEICRKLENLNIIGLTCNKNTTLLKKQIKDFGNIFPGHGGLLDRIDSSLFILWLGYFILLNWINL